MPRRTRSPQLETRTSRLKLRVQKKPVFVKVAAGVSLGYRRNQTAGTWVVRVADGKGGNWTKAIGVADDVEEGNGGDILDYWQAQDRARAAARAGNGETGFGKLLTLAEALDAYEADLKTRGGDIGNVGRVRIHLPASLAAKSVINLTEAELRRWRDGLVKTLSPATVNRTATVAKAALNLAADLDGRIASRHAWEVGLATLPGAEQSRNVILADEVVQALVAAAYDSSQEFGLLVDTCAVTGARYSQIARLECQDLQISAAPRLMMPSSNKGKKGARPKIVRRSVPISAALAGRLAEAAKGRPGNARLLVKPSGEKWAKSDHSRPFGRVAARCGLADWQELGYPTKITIYALRHSSIVRQIKRNVPIRIVAVTHDTSVAMIERHYSAEIADFADELARAALLVTGTGGSRSIDAAPAAEVVDLAERRAVGQ